MADIIEATKKAALDAIKASKPSGVYFGTVTSVSPLKINLEQKMTLEASQLILMRNVTDSAIHNGLVNGDKVVLLRVQGGQKYIVLDVVTS